MLHRLMVGQRILTPSILVRVQVKQPTKTTAFMAVFLLGNLSLDANQIAIASQAACAKRNVAKRRRSLSDTSLNSSR